MGSTAHEILDAFEDLGVEVTRKLGQDFRAGRLVLTQAIDIPRLSNIVSVARRASVTTLEPLGTKIDTKPRRGKLTTSPG